MKYLRRGLAVSFGAWFSVACHFSMYDVGMFVWLLLLVSFFMDIIVGNIWKGRKAG